ncbi:diguanylate cyclase (GGDEF)-like protein/PAS domain S-box-containing protein [Cytobacillus eiseniae]|uniref:Diguanylate cyclase (GGDEF)-like protein/PAS domain S-box-containing protein n=1 Tax=Cytobacillus eiseniae TaxID=762947 RepID=A0ABS4RB90_9BACI|nr:EAL domain-containing protein [Cytobacillus eiseniae]MBP2239610.1 diguanylate cyclase (GGDEF)-like protein/PAS domain S-box-containing protein [Cytobacillus eiseniae]
MFEQDYVQSWLNSLHKIFENTRTNYTSLIEMEKDVQKISTFMEDYTNLRYALDVSAIVAVTNTEGTILYANDKFCELSKYSREELLGQNHRILNSGYHDKHFFKKMWDTINHGDIWESEVKNKAKDGTYYWVKTTIVPLKDLTGKPVMYIAIRTDISEGKLAQEKLVEAMKNDFSHVVNSMNNLIFKVAKDQNGSFKYILNEGKLCYTLGLEHNKMLHKKPEEIFPLEISEMLICKYHQAFDGKPITYNYAFHDRQLLTYLSPIYRDGEVVEIIGCINDITELHHVQEEVEFMAFHDLLTSLPNRRKFCDDLNHLIKKSDKKIAVLFLDLDRFKQINDSLGHTVGDQLLIEVANKLKSYADHEAKIYRLAGDEFIIVYPGIDNKEIVIKHAEHLLSIFEESIQINTNEVYTTCSMGVSIFPDHGEDCESLLKKADVAMYAAKMKGRNHYCIYEQAMNQTTEEALLIENHLRKAIDNNELELYFQPKLDLVTREINGMEALLRWNSPIFGNVPPDRFIPIAEDTGLIIKIDNWVLEEACEQNKKWNHSWFSTPLRVAVNISPLHFRLPNFQQVVANVIEKTGLEPNLLEIEITENSFIDHIDECIECLQYLQKMGITVAIDDFGKGYSSLNYLRKFPIQSLKIDRSFIHEVSKNREDIAIVKAITYLAHELNLKVVAEGIESREVLDILEEIGCDEIQGFYISKPLPKKEFEAVYRSLTKSLK